MVSLDGKIKSLISTSNYHIHQIKLLFNLEQQLTKALVMNHGAFVNCIYMLATVLKDAMIVQEIDQKIAKLEMILLNSIPPLLVPNGLTLILMAGLFIILIVKSNQQYVEIQRCLVGSTYSDSLLQL